ncbi:uncharacterized protein [Dermacentor albipictus]|uniref:uncharacterized protein n=1 Tax=Dermacentor albipictus TaxID=60249 RepID=UPI0038FBF994
MFKNRIVKASRMPQLPEEHSKIIIRPRGGLNLSKVSTTAIGVAIIEASGLTPQQAREDVVCPNFTQNIVVVSTPDPSHAARYVRIRSIVIGETEYEVNAYETAPHTTCKGVIRRVDLRDNQATITQNIVHDFNPLALAAKRIKSTGSVIVLFDGLKVPSYVRYGSTLVRCYLYRKQLMSAMLAERLDIDQMYVQHQTWYSAEDVELKTRRTITCVCLTANSVEGTTQLETRLADSGTKFHTWCEFDDENATDLNRGRHHLSCNCMPKRAPGGARAQGAPHGQEAARLRRAEAAPDHVKCRCASKEEGRRLATRRHLEQPGSTK